MRRSLPLFSVLSATALLGLAGCSGGEDAVGPAGTVGTAPTTTPTTVRPIDPSVIPQDPADIDEAYVQAVVDALFAVDAQATKIFVETKAPDPEAVDYLRAIYLQKELEQQVDVWFKSLARGADDLLPGALKNDVTRLISVTGDCVFFEVSRDYSDTAKERVPPRTVYLGVTPKGEGDDPEHLNPTSWMLFSDGFNADGSQPEDPCEGR